MARCRVLFGARPRRTESALVGVCPLPRSSHMTIEEIEDVVRALIAVAEKLETGEAKKSIRDAFLQTQAYADEMLAPSSERSRRRLA
jgi:hypothetical protein